MPISYSGEQVRILREATNKACELAAIQSEIEKTVLAHYVLSAFRAGIIASDYLANRAVTQFSLRNHSSGPILPGNIPLAEPSRLRSE